MKEFTWTMVKFAIIFDNTLSKEESHLTNYHKLMSDLTTDENGKKCYQGVQLKHFKRATYNIRKKCCKREKIFPVLQPFAQMSRKGLVTLKSQKSLKTLNPY